MVNIQDVQLTDYAAHHVIQGLNNSINKGFIVPENTKKVINASLAYKANEFVLHRQWIRGEFDERDSVEHITNTIHSNIQSLIDYVIESVNTLDYKEKYGFTVLPYTFMKEHNSFHRFRINIAIQDIIIEFDAHRDPDPEKTIVNLGVSYFISKDIGLIVKK